jgi:CHASE3 domain sensor protein
LLATLLRRTRRWPEAHEQLAALKRLEAVAAWNFEIAEEEQRLAEAQEQSAVEVGEVKEDTGQPAMLHAA